MSIKLVESEIRRFIAAREPEVICLTGRWGVGKTFAWNRYLRDACTNNGVGLKRYSYVSLFGVNSLDEARYAVFENSVTSSGIGIEPSLETLRSNAKDVLERLGKRVFGFLNLTPLTRDYVGGLGPVWFSSVKETLICIDDVERRGQDLSVRDVLGLVSNLKERKACRVVLILNDEALEEEKEDFQRYFEKVVDACLVFAPSAEDCARIALVSNSRIGRLLAQRCVALGISNIRLIKKIERCVQTVEPLLAEFDEQVLNQAVQSLALLGWSKYEPDSAPSLAFLKTGRAAGLFRVKREELAGEKEASWNALLDAYGWSAMDEFDLVLLDGILNGFFDQSLIAKHGSQLNDNIEAAKRGNSLSNAWKMYHDSFAANEDQVVNSVYESCITNVQYITPVNLNGAVQLLKGLGRPQLATEVIKHYVVSRGKEREIFDLAHYPFTNHIDDPDVVKAFEDKCATIKDERDPTAILLSISKQRGWNPEDIEILTNLSIDRYYEIFKNNEADDLATVIDSCLLFDRISNASAAMAEIPKRAKEALRIIGRESRLNAMRVRKYGIEV